MKNRSEDLLKDAIADAKTVRATALANAKLALEEAFTPKLQSMLSAKIRQEADDEEDEIEDVADELEDVSDELDDLEDGSEDEVEAEVEEEVEDEIESEVEEEVEDEMEAEVEDEIESEVEDDDDDLDLEAIIRELEGDDEVEDEMEAEVEDDEDDLDLDLDIEDDEVEDEMDEEFDLSALLGEVDDEDVEDETNSELEEANKNLEEAYGVIRTLQNRINEINLLNAKLLYANKLFKVYNLDEGKKVKIIETIDRASNVREVKLIYSTLAESYKEGVAKKAKPSRTITNLTESMASKSAKTTRPNKKEILTEENEQVKRFKKLANISQ